MGNHSNAFDDVFRALADPTRRAVLERLAKGPATISDLAAPFDMALPSFMKHIRLLEESGFIHSRKEGRVRTCTLERARFGTIECWLAEQQAIWEAHADRLEQLVLAKEEFLRAKMEKSK
ncbi:ArsR/SmtB family transcription factor [Rhizobium puerariae]|uniref:ArsR/SmtB family transcription factor n=1 Tax=Rhizobium puerariae TaxID=1585791 RepID=A0ABV6AAY4_9HYPH